MTENVANEHLKRIVENIERYEEDKKEIGSQISDIYKEAATLGFNAKIIRKIVRIRKNEEEYTEEEILLETYKSALGMQKAFDFNE